MTENTKDNEIQIIQINKKKNDFSIRC